MCASPVNTALAMNYYVFSAVMKLIQFVNMLYFRVLLEHAVRACLQGFRGWLVFSI